MTPEEFEFWQAAFLAALAGLSANSKWNADECDSMALEAAILAVVRWRTAKSTVVQTSYATGE